MSIRGAKPWGSGILADFTSLRGLGNIASKNSRKRGVGKKKKAKPSGTPGGKKRGEVRNSTQGRTSCLKRVISVVWGKKFIGFNGEI